MGKFIGIGLTIVVLIGAFNLAMAVIMEIGGIGIAIGFFMFAFLLGVPKLLDYRNNAYQRQLNLLAVEEKKVSLQGQLASVQSQLADVQRKITIERLVPADANGLFPLTVDALNNHLTQAANLQIAYRFQESKDNVLQSLTYSPRSSNTNMGADVLPVALSSDNPTFWQLVEQNKLPKDKMLLGFDENNEQVTATWNALRSTLIGGKSGTGKSTALRLMLAQAALQDSSFVVIDPHYMSGEESLGHSLQPLKHLMLADVAYDDKTIAQALGYVQGIGESRLAGRDTDRKPIVLVVDEVTALLSRSNIADELNKTLQFIATETRKVNVFCFCAGQNFNASIMPSETRNNFVSMFGFQMRRDTARAMSGSTDFAQQVESLAIGQMVWFSPSGVCTPVAVPNVTESDLQRVADRRFGKTLDIGVNADFPQTSHRLPEGWKVVESDADLDGGKSTESDFDDSGSLPEAMPEVCNSLENARIVQLFLAENSITTIVREIYGLTGGREFSKKSEYVQSVIRGKLR